MSVHPWSPNIEVLESRTLLSRGTASMAAKLDADRVAITADLAHLKLEVAAAKSVVAAARAARDDHQDALGTLLKQLRVQRKREAANATVITNALKDGTQKVIDKWNPTLLPEMVDVNDDAEGESDEERAADSEKFEADKTLAFAELNVVQQTASDAMDALGEKLTALADQYAAAKQASDSQARSDDLAVTKAERSLKRVFQADRSILDAHVSLYRQHGGKVESLRLSLPTI